MEDPPTDAVSDPTTEILLSSLDDWVSLAEARSLVQDSLPASVSSVEVRTKTLSVIDDLLRRGLMEAGQLTPRFTAWNGTPDAILNGIAQEWTDDEGLWLGSICWLANTPTCKEVAGRLVDRGSSAQDASGA